jgi:hypothetical protein
MKIVYYFYTNIARKGLLVLGSNGKIFMARGKKEVGPPSCVVYIGGTYILVYTCADVNIYSPIPVNFSPKGLSISDL